MRSTRASSVTVQANALCAGAQADAMPTAYSIRATIAARQTSAKHVRAKAKPRSLPLIATVWQ